MLSLVSILAVSSSISGSEDDGAAISKGPADGFQPLVNETSPRILWLLKYVDIDIDYARWLGWLFTPIIITFVLPAIILILLYLSALFLHIYKWHRYISKILSAISGFSVKREVLRFPGGLTGNFLDIARHRIREAYEHDFWEGARKTLAALWDAQGWLWHGYEVVGLENIPETGGALIVFYHGAIPIDFYYLMSRYILLKGRLIRCVGDRFLFKIPGWSLMMEAFKVIPGTVHSCANILKEGNVLAIAPGGVYEAQFGNERYQLMWKSRVGFAKVALEAKVPVIPMFTLNIREGFRSVSWGSKFWRWLYSKTHFPLVPIYGFFPVKMKTFIGKPIPYDPNNTPEMLSQQAAHAIESLIKEHQRIPGSIVRALIARFYKTTPNSKVN